MLKLVINIYNKAIEMLTDSLEYFYVLCLGAGHCGGCDGGGDLDEDLGGDLEAVGDGGHHLLEGRGPRREQPELLRRVEHGAYDPLKHEPSHVLWLQVAELDAPRLPNIIPNGNKFTIKRNPN